MNKEKRLRDKQLRKEAGCRKKKKRKKEGTGGRKLLCGEREPMEPELAEGEEEG